MKKTTVLAALALMIIILSSCVKADDIRVVELEQWTVESLTKPLVTVRIRNDSRRNIQILSGRFTLDTPSGKVAEVMLTDEVLIPKKSETSITLPLRVRISNPLAAASLIGADGINADRLSITGQAEVKAGSAKRNFTVENAPVSRFLSIFGANQTKHSLE